MPFGINLAGHGDLESGLYFTDTRSRDQKRNDLIRNSIHNILSKPGKSDFIAAGGVTGAAYKYFTGGKKDKVNMPKRGPNVVFVGPQPETKKVKKAPRKKMKAKRKTGGLMKYDGVGGGKRIKAKSGNRHVKKKSLKKRIKALEGKAPPLTVHRTIKIVPWKFEQILSNSAKYYEIDLRSAGEVHGVVSKLESVSDGTQYRVQNVHTHWELKNNSLGNCEIEYQFFQVRRPTKDRVLDELQKWINEKSEPQKTFSNVTPAGGYVLGTKNRTPISMNMDNALMHYPVWAGNRYSANNWKVLGNIAKASMGPGDIIAINYNSGKFFYELDKEEKMIDAGGGIFTTTDVHCVIKIVGSLGHPNNTPALVGFGTHHIDAISTTVTEVSHQDGTGKKSYNVVSEEMTVTNSTTQVHADNRQGAVHGHEHTQ